MSQGSVDTRLVGPVEVIEAPVVLASGVPLVQIELVIADRDVMKNPVAHT